MQYSFYTQVDKGGCVRVCVFVCLCTCIYIVKCYLWGLLPLHIWTVTGSSSVRYRHRNMLCTNTCKWSVDTVVSQTIKHLVKHHTARSMKNSRYTTGSSASGGMQSNPFTGLSDNFYLSPHTCSLMYFCFECDPSEEKRLFNHPHTQCCDCVKKKQVISYC